MTLELKYVQLMMGLSRHNPSYIEYNQYYVHVCAGKKVQRSKNYS
jgi:hypothetical protein